ncbi:MAG: Eco57I restriction-modification methylase domain-containing protein, partial [Clostridium sp.]|nr:Eco57I restriction-modification methylase domain-containing protein [Clostridium sp.]
RSGCERRKFYDTGRPSEWYKVDLQTAINAIKAYKEGRNVLSAAEKNCQTILPALQTEEKIELRSEQKAAVEKTLNIFRKEDKMLWNCKMRFGKTVSSWELIRQGGYQKTIVVTHRPVVVSGWQEDLEKIFGKNSEHLFVTKETGKQSYVYDAAIDAANERSLRNYAQMGRDFTYFASMQDLAGSQIVGGSFAKNRAVFDMDWDLIIYDEAHEGTQTERGQAVQNLLQKPKKGKTPKVLELSGTPYNIQDKYESNVYTWDYVMEQQTKRKFAEEHPHEDNPYEGLPEMRIYTFDLHKALAGAYRYETADMAFNFREFFRVWTGDPSVDFRPIPAGAKKGDFVHADDVCSFLDLISRADEGSLYPFANEQFRNIFRHTFWIVPGVKAAQALSKMLNEHPIFGSFKVANVAGEGDAEEPYDDALQKVREVINHYPYTITISCGKLTTGVTVPEWSAVMMLSGSATPSATGYMQTIFRVQSPGSVNGRQKNIAYVFDFAPDRALKVLTDAHNLSKKNKQSDNDSRGALGEFLNFCPVIAVDGTNMQEYNVAQMMRQLKRVTVDSAIRNGFEDESIYNDNVGLVMSDSDIEIFKKLSDVLSGQKKSAKTNVVPVNQHGLTNEEYEQAEKLKNKPKRQRSPEELELLKKLQEARKDREKVISLLRAVSIRLPMLIYGARDADFNENVSLADFAVGIDEESWQVFMPENLTKDLFKQLLRYYDTDVVIGAGMRIRSMARAADELPPSRRAQRIAEIFGYFRNPNKETVLTPWRVVNMHMGDTIGGYNFYGEGYGDKDVLSEPRLIENGEVMADIFLNENAKVLEMNSKSGLYPLYLANSFYCLALDKPEKDLPLEDTQRILQEVLSKQVYVLCMSPMARLITRRTLAGFHEDWTVNAIYLPKLLERMKDDQPRLARKLCNPHTWGKEGEKLKFDAVVGNPPYDVMDGGAQASSKPIYQFFIQGAKALEPNYASFILPTRWYAGGKGLDEFREEMLNDEHIAILHDCLTPEQIFPNTNIRGGVCWFLWDKEYDNKTNLVRVVTHANNKIIGDNMRPLKIDGLDIFIRNPLSVNIINKVFSDTNSQSIMEYVSPRKPFGLEGFFNKTEKFKYNKDELQNPIVC